MAEITTDDGTFDLAALSRALDGVRDRIRPANSDDDIAGAITGTRTMLAMVAEPIAAFVNALDDGIGASNSTDDFGKLLAASLDEVHLFTLTLALNQALSREHFETVTGIVELMSRPGSDAGTDE
ncbi:hypothetical protein [Cellulosimicrobium sp. 22601]|uniref:hypothetical protein n=1 Tax=unclassified Cellulosimicrobium TaxID=2624466 RepID=UPI003F828C23